jgi:predicted RNA-binding Zn-ribbon protein involved in translation (DUF1610 family)
MWSYIIWGAVLLIIIGMLVQMRTRFSIYVCPRCRYQFRLTSFREFIFPQVMYRKIVRCPNCRKIVAAGIIRDEKALAMAEEAQKTKEKNNSAKRRQTKNKGKKK